MNKAVCDSPSCQGDILKSRTVMACTPHASGHTDHRSLALRGFFFFLICKKKKKKEKCMHLKKIPSEKLSISTAKTYFQEMGLKRTFWKPKG